MSDEPKTIIDPKYASALKEKDWLARFIDGEVTEAQTREKTKKHEDGTETVETVQLKRTRVDLDKLFLLCRENGISEEMISKMEEQRDRPNAPGRIRMTLGNSLRAATRRRGGLYSLDGEWHDAPEEIMQGKEATHDRSGNRIATKKEDEAA